MSAYVVMIRERVIDPAEMDATIEGALVSNYRNSGQTCICTNRFYMQVRMLVGYHMQEIQPPSREILSASDRYWNFLAKG